MAQDGTEHEPRTYAIQPTENGVSVREREIYASQEI